MKQSLTTFKIPQFAKVSYDKSSFFAFYLSTMIWFTPLRTVLIEVSNEFVPGVGRLLSRISILIFFIYIIYPVCHWIRLKKEGCLIVLFIILQWGRTFIFHIDEAFTWVSVLNDFLIQVFPFYVIARQTSDWKLVKQKFYKSGIITIILMAGMTGVKMIGENGLFHNNANYSMFWGFLMGRAATVVLVAFLDTKRLKYLCMFIISVPFVILYGIRTPLVCIFFTAFLYLIVALGRTIKMHRDFIKSQTIRLCAVIFIMLMVSIAFVQRLRTTAMNVLAPGYRVLYAIIHGDFFRSDGRVRIYKICMEIITEHPFFGTGILEDRVKIAEQFGGSFLGTYAHNLVIEWILQFGIILGGFLFLFLAILCKRLLFNTADRDKQLAAVYFIGFGISFLMLSGTTFDSCELWALLGMGLGTMNLSSQNRSYAIETIQEKRISWKDL